MLPQRPLANSQMLETEVRSGATGRHQTIEGSNFERTSGPLRRLSRRVLRRGPSTTGD
jgi:hypothetical protein